MPPASGAETKVILSDSNQFKPGIWKRRAQRQQRERDGWETVSVWRHGGSVTKAKQGSRDFRPTGFMTLARGKHAKRNQALGFGACGAGTVYQPVKKLWTPPLRGILALGAERRRSISAAIWGGGATKPQRQKSLSPKGFAENRAATSLFLAHRSTRDMLARHASSAHGFGRNGGNHSFLTGCYGTRRFAAAMSTHVLGCNDWE